MVPSKRLTLNHWLTGLGQEESGRHRYAVHRPLAPPELEAVPVVYGQSVKEVAVAKRNPTIETRTNLLRS